MGNKIQNTFVVVGARRTEAYFHFRQEADLGFSCNIHSQHSEKGERQDRLEEKRIGTYHCQHNHNYLPIPPQLVQSKRWGGRTEEEPQKLSHTLIRLS